MLARATVSTEVRLSAEMLVAVVSTTRLSLPAASDSVPLSEVKPPVCSTSSPVPPVTFCALAPSVKLFAPAAS